MRTTRLMSGLRGLALALMVLMGCAASGAAQSRERIDYWRTKYQELQPTDAPRAQQAQNIFQRLVQVAGKRPGVVPRLFIMTSDPWDLALPIALPDGWIILSKSVLDTCYREPQGGDDRLAFVLAHELAHQLKDDFWHIRFFQAYEASKTRNSAELEKIRQTVGTGEHVLARELQADEHGIIYAAMAGFNTQAVVTEDQQFNFFADWVRARDPRRLEGGPVEQARPTPQERAAALRAHLRQVVDQTAMFQSGLWFYYAGNYPQAIQAFEYFQRMFPSREVSHNLATSHHQLALQAYQVWKQGTPPQPFHLPLAIDPVTRASQIYLDGLTRRSNGIAIVSPEAQFREHLEKAIHLYREALERDPSYTPAAINLGCALMTRGSLAQVAGLNADLTDAATKLLMALPHDPDAPALLNTLGVALFHIGQPEQAKSHLTRAQALAPTYTASACNLAYILRATQQTTDPSPDASVCQPPVAQSAAAYAAQQRPEQVLDLTIGRLEDRIPAQWGAAIRSTFEVEKKRLSLAAYPLGVMTIAQDKEILMIMVREGYSGSSEKGITLGSMPQDVLTAYGSPSRRFETFHGESWRYDAYRIAFQFRAGKVVSWLVF